MVVGTLMLVLHLHTKSIGDAMWTNMGISVVGYSASFFYFLFYSLQFFQFNLIEELIIEF